MKSHHRSIKLPGGRIHRSDGEDIESIGRYKFSYSIRQTSSGLLRRATDERGQNFAIKIIPKENLREKVFARQLHLEVRINQMLHHPGVVRICDLLKDQLFYYVVLEYSPGDSLYNKIRGSKRLPIHVIRGIWRQLLVTLKYIHSQGVCHRDLKPEKIIVDSSNNCKISDFEFAWISTRYGPCVGQCGAVAYSPPESFSGCYDGKKGDIWSLGILFYATLTGKIPWDSANPEQMKYQIQRGRFDIPLAYGADVVRILRGMLKMNPDDRVSLDELLSDSWIQQGRFFTTQSFLSIVPMLSLRKMDKFFKRDEDLDYVSKYAQNVRSKRSNSVSWKDTKKIVHILKMS